MIHNTISSPPLQCSLTWDSLVSCFVEKKKRETVQCFWMLSVFLKCDLQNKSSLYNPRQIKFRKIKLFHKLAGYSRVSYSQNGEIVFLLLHSHHLDLSLCFQGVYHWGLRRLKGPGNTSWCCTCNRAHDREITNSPFCPHHHHHRCHLCILSRYLK